MYYFNTLFYLADEMKNLEMIQQETYYIWSFKMYIPFELNTKYIIG